MSQKEKYKICLVGECLSLGGAEKTMALLSRFFASKGIEVHTVIVIDSVVYQYSGTLLNLGKMKNESNGILNKFRRFRTLKKYLSKNHFDYIIDFRIRTSFLQEFMISKWLYPSPTIYTIHSSMTDLYFPNVKWQAQAIYKNAFGLVTVSHAIEKIIQADYDLTNTKTIHNPVDVEAIQNLSLVNIPEETRYILAAGRMKIDVKQFDKLIVAYSRSVLPQYGIKLIILGDGEKRAALEKLVIELKLQQLVILKGHVENPYPYMKKALFFALSSKREGLPTVILESLACGTPVVAFDCISGPAEMITDGKNGLLVADQDFSKLVEAMNLFITDQVLYRHCKANAKEGAMPFSLENIGRQWLEFLKIM
jgi:N-acetylgalactosamine-N,N'-diacetylbacillosaminyl-diphospho-undecaprenol 4-alpha-N-acetylgalactosaminyltransferase